MRMSPTMVLVKKRGCAACVAMCLQIMLGILVGIMAGRGYDEGTRECKALTALCFIVQAFYALLSTTTAPFVDRVSPGISCQGPIACLSGSRRHCS